MDPLPATPLYLPLSLPFPLTVQRIHSPTSTSVLKTQSLCTFSYAVTTKEGKKEREVKVWESPVEGQVTEWVVREGETIRDASKPVVHIREPCTHDVQLHGLCALCGKDLTVTDYTGFSDTTRAAISMVHDVGGLTVSLEEAHRLETLTAKRLLSSKKLSLIVDLDQTIIHATVDPTVGEWLGDQRNPNHKALKGVQRFKLGDEGEEGCWYYVKQRPGLKQFLEDIAKIYEMHVYTMGTRAYAIEVCKVIDPEGRLFGGRILSRDESGSMTRKSLQRLFPCDTNMVVIIDDRADVWDGSPNLVKVIPYEFFVGIGDINAAFLPKKKELTAPGGGKKASTKGTAASASSASSSSSESGGASTAPSSPVIAISDLLVTPSPDADDLSSPTTSFPSLDTANSSNAAMLHDQIENRPLAKKQAEAASHSNANSSASTPATSESAGVESDDEDDEEEEMEEAVLKDDDDELDRVFRILKHVRNQFFEEVEGGSTSADVKTIIPGMKRQVLSGQQLVFSGLVALGTRPHDSEYWKLATTFGADCSADLTRRTTHVVAKESGTAKVQQARRSPDIRVVWAQWLLDCAAHWTRLPEENYLLPPPEPSSSTAPAVSTPSVATPSEDPLQRSTTPPLDPEAEEGLSDALDFDPGEMDWDDAAKEVDDFLNETDDDDAIGGGEDTDDGASAAGDESDTGSAKSGSKKRGRLTDSEDEGATRPNGLKSKALGEAVVAAGSPLQKRVKTSRARKSKLKVSFPASASATEDEGIVPPQPTSSQDGAPTVSISKDSSAAATEGGTDSAPASPFPTYEASQASSSLDSDDEAFFASMAAEVEKGWS